MPIKIELFSNGTYIRKCYAALKIHNYKLSYCNSSNDHLVVKYIYWNISEEPEEIPRQSIAQVSALSLLRAQVQSLVRKLKSHKPRGAAPKKKPMKMLHQNRSSIQFSGANQHMHFHSYNLKGQTLKLGSVFLLSVASSKELLYISVGSNHLWIQLNRLPSLLLLPFMSSQG